MYIYLNTIQVTARTSAGYGPDSSPFDMSIGPGTVSKSSSEHVTSLFQLQYFNIAAGRKL